MATNPYAWAQNYASQESQRAGQRESDSTQMLLNLFQEEAARQRPYVTMPARLAEAQQDRINAEPFAERAAQRRYRNSKAGAAAVVSGDDGIKQLEDGSWVEVIDGAVYPADPPAEQ